MNHFDYKKESESDGAEEIYSKIVRAGRRTYFFDVKAKKTEKDGKFSFEKHKIHLYKEDFCKFAEGLDEVVGYIREHKPECFNPDGSAISSIPASLDDEFDKL